VAGKRDRHPPSYPANRDALTVAVTEPAGEIVKRDKRLLGLDLPRGRAHVDAARDGLFRRANVSSDGSWLPRPFSEGADVEG